MSALIASLVCSGSSGQALTISAKSGYFCTILSKLVAKTGFAFSIRCVFTGVCELPPRGSNPLGAIWLKAINTGPYDDLSV